MTVKSEGRGRGFTAHGGPKRMNWMKDYLSEIEFEKFNRSRASATRLNQKARALKAGVINGNGHAASPRDIISKTLRGGGEQALLFIGPTSEINRVIAKFAGS